MPTPFHGKPVVPSDVFTSKRKEVSIETLVGGIVIATVSLATPSLSRIVTAL